MSLTITAVATPTNLPPRIRIAVSGAAPANASAPFTLVRVDPDGIGRPVILPADSRLTAGGWNGWDYHPPFNRPVAYQVTVGAEPPAASIPVTLAVTVPWLIHRTDPSLSVQPDKVVSIADKVYGSTAAAHFPFGAEFPVTISEGVRRARTGTIVVRISSPAAAAAMVALLADSGVILLNLAGPRPGWWDEDWAWIQPGDIGVANPADGNIFFRSRQISLPYQVVDTPAGAIAPLWTWADLIATYATWADVRAAYSTWRDVVTDSRT